MRDTITLQATGRMKSSQGDDIDKLVDLLSFPRENCILWSMKISYFTNKCATMK